ncbi:bifunctional nuclease domain-containing protein [Litchfieldella xinjiangensis]|uniref:bifunctional nuclease domain-containing protein n=1 Tax=Litchfieldella xinjiangensis TaxID=1166948 RepID=UPI0005B7A149|nr:bifunctional nuclease domain-containing protein [Halomonas xinjiangensis]
MTPIIRSRIRACLLACLLILHCIATASARELAVPLEDMAEVEIASVAVTGPSGPPVVLLREPGERAVIPIFVGPVEATAILRGLRGDRPYRPMTHELVSTMLRDMDARLERVYIDDLLGGTFLGMLELHMDGRDTPLYIDSRPSDAIALALYGRATIHVSPKVMAASRYIEYRGMDDQVVTAVGVTVTALDDELREALALPNRPGLLVSGVSGPARQAGLEPGALLLAVNGKPPETPMDFLDTVRKTPRDEDVRLRYWQGGNTHELDISTDVPSPRPSQRMPPGLRSPAQDA